MVTFVYERHSGMVHEQRWGHYRVISVVLTMNEDISVSITYIRCALWQKRNSDCWNVNVFLKNVEMITMKIIFSFWYNIWIGVGETCTAALTIYVLFDLGVGNTTNDENIYLQGLFRITGSFSNFDAWRQKSSNKTNIFNLLDCMR